MVGRRNGPGRSGGGGMSFWSVPVPLALCDLNNALRREVKRSSGGYKAFITSVAIYSCQ
ncbi:hypothetical protein C7449_104558 [Mycoplana dimorpha]|uniref:Uncharacterized protein n=1 Tax=Mycoplana dimorpha TaxID=28320 RepID=A0A2T5B950_MYCDI|nr:hypothetical protein C7449_104558 [Mycoplana dimorpha]